VSIDNTLFETQFCLYSLGSSHCDVKPCTYLTCLLIQARLDRIMNYEENYGLWGMMKKF